MQSDAIFNLIEQIAATASKNEKVALLKEGCKSETFMKVMSAAYNPLVTFGMDNMPERVVREYGGPNVDNEFSDATWKIIDDLALRTLTGNEARFVVEAEFNRLTEGSAELLKRIIKKDLRAGFSGSSINKAAKGLIPEFPYQRCTLPKDAKLDEFDWEAGVISQEKADGMFANVDHEVGGVVRITSRQGSEFPLDHLGDLVGEVRTRLNAGSQSHGELLVVKAGKIMARAEGNGVLNGIASGGALEADEHVIYKVWDSIPLSAVVPKGKYVTDYRTRLRNMVLHLKATPGNLISVIDTRIVHSLAQAYRHAGDLMKLGKEGTIISDPNAPWIDGTSKFKVKLKLEFEVDLEIVAILPAKADTKHEGRAGSMTSKTSCGKLLVDVTVKNEDMRGRVDANPEDWIGRIIVVLANEIVEPSESNENHSLFLPRMIEPNYRTDKVQADDLDRVYAAKELAILGVQLKEAA